MRVELICKPPGSVDDISNHRDETNHQVTNNEISNEQSTSDKMIFLRGSLASRQASPRCGGAPTLYPAKNGTLGQHPTIGARKG